MSKPRPFSKPKPFSDPNMFYVHPSRTDGGISFPVTPTGIIPSGGMPTAMQEAVSLATEASKPVNLLLEEAIRLLLEAEWVSNSESEYRPVCPWCGGGKPEPEDEEREYGPRVRCDGHADDCRLVALLRRAGVRP